MQNEMHEQHIESVEVSNQLRELTPSIEAIDEYGPDRKLRLRIRLPRRPACLTRRAMVAALREAELQRWESSGGDYLRSIARIA